MKNLVALLVLFTFAITLMAQAPQAFNYQGVARTLSGQSIANQNIGLRIALLQNSPTGTEVYKEIHLVETNNLGLFSIQIGNGSAVSGVFSDINWGAETHFLQIEMDENGGGNYQLIGVSQLLSVPYALYARKGGGLWSENDQSVYYLDKPVGVGTSNPFEQLEIYSEGGNVGVRITNAQNSESDFSALRFFQDEVQKGVVYSHLDNFYVRGSLPENNLILQGHEIDYPQGNIGIGTHDPRSKLQVSNGDIYIENVNKGVIMKSPNGQCWRMTVNNSGQPEFTSIPCP